MLRLIAVFAAATVPQSCVHIMAHEIAKLLLEHAETASERQEAIKNALALGMPIYEVEQYLDWLDSIHNFRLPLRPQNTDKPSEPEEL